MMRWIILAVAVVALTALGMTIVQFLPAPRSSEKGLAFPQGPTAEIKGPPGHVVVDQDLTFDFGNMAQHTTGDHTWKITNEGKGDLILERGTKTCSCTSVGVGDVKQMEEGQKAVLKPGESTTVKLTWDTKANSGDWSQSANIEVPTDDARQKLVFVVKGGVAPAVVVYPPARTIPFVNISNTDPHQGSIYLFSPDKDDLTITSMKLSKPKWFSAKILPLNDEERAELKIKQGGLKVQVETQVDLPLGDINEELVIATDHPKNPDLRIALTGKVLGPISLMPERVRMTGVASDRGAKETVMLFVRGSGTTKFDVDALPPDLKVDIASMDQAGGAQKAQRYKMTVTVPPGVSPKEITGWIVLKTDHPHAGELKIPVYVRVEDKG